MGSAYALLLLLWGTGMVTSSLTACVMLTAPLAAYQVHQVLVPEWVWANPFWESQLNGLVLIMPLVGQLLGAPASARSLLSSISVLLCLIPVLVSVPRMWVKM